MWRSAAQREYPADPEQRVGAAPAVAGGVTLDAAADLVEGGEGEPHDREGIEHSSGLRQRGTGAARAAASGSASSWAEFKCSISRDPRRDEYTIWTAVAPDAVFTVRT